MMARHEFGAVPFPTRAHFRARLEAIGLGRWGSLFPGACNPLESSSGRDGRWRS